MGSGAEEARRYARQYLLECQDHSTRKGDFQGSKILVMLMYSSLATEVAAECLRGAREIGQM